MSLLESQQGFGKGWNTISCFIPLRPIGSGVTSLVIYFGFLFAGVAWLSMEAQEAPPGILARYQAIEGTSGVQDLEVFERLAFFGPANQPVTPFFDEPEYEIVWDGDVSVPLRDDYRFRAFVQGSFELAVNGSSVLKSEGSTGWSEASEEVRLSKGTNAVRLTFRNDPKRDAVVRLEWSSPDFLFEPIKPEHWTYQPSAGLQEAVDLRTGRELYLGLRCGACHDESADKISSDSGKGAVNLDRLASRRRPGWLRDWLLDPSGMRQDARMPRMFHGSMAEDEVDSLLAFLVKETGPLDSGAVATDDPSIQKGKEQFGELLCGRCHGVKPGEREDETRLWLGAVAQKFSLVSLAQFIEEPARHYPEIRMPHFGLSAAEAMNLASFLYSESLPAKAVNVQVNDAQVEAGRAVLSRRGCLNCHAGLSREDDQSNGLGQLEIVQADQGCLADEANRETDVPAFQLSTDERRVLLQWVQSEHKGGTRRVPRVDSQRHTRNLRCAACHRDLEGVTSFEYLGGKLKTSWMHRLFRGEVDSKPRPWLSARMPAFPAFAEELALGLGHAHGYGRDEVPAGPGDDSDLAEIGRQLVSPINGFSCVSCHGVADLKPTQVFESEGINFSYSGERLRKDYYRRWLLNPVRIDPASKMPVYFDEEGYSPLFDVLDGDTDRQLEAIWQYFLLGEEMLPPALE